MRYLRAGLCGECAAQAEWGHQLGFGYRGRIAADRIKLPCAGCAPIVAAMPVPASRGTRWRRLPSRDVDVPPAPDPDLGTPEAGGHEGAARRHLPSPSRMKVRSCDR